MSAELGKARVSLRATLTTLTAGVGIAGLFFVGGHAFFDAAFSRPDWTWARTLIGETPQEECTRFVDNLAARFLVVAMIVTAAHRSRMDRATFYRRFVGPAGPESVASLRIFAAGILFVSAVWEDVESLALVPRELLRPHGMMHLFFALPGWDAFVASPAALRLFDVLTCATLLAAALGLFTRVTVPLGVVFYYVLAGLMRAPFWSYHTGLIPWYALLSVAFMPAHHAWSVDAWRRRDRPRRAQTDALRARYGWSRFLGAFIIAMPYAEAGLSKLCNGGLLWWGPTNMRAILYMDSLSPMEFDVSLALSATTFPDAFFAALGLAAVIGETAMAAALFSRRARLVLPAMMAGMHVGIVLTQNILFFDLLVLLMIFYVWAWLEDDPASPWYVRELLPRWLRAIRPLPTPASRTRPLKNSSRALLQPARPLIGFAGVFAFCWIFAIEFFPLTAMQMYSRLRDSGRVEYYQVVAHHADGNVGRAYVEHAIPALRDGRFRRALRLCFDDRARPTCEALMQTAGARLNADRAASPIEAIEVRQRAWDFRRAPEDPEHGETLATVRVAIAG